MNLDLLKVLNGLVLVSDFQYEVKLQDEFLKEINSIDASQFIVAGSAKKVDKKLMITFDYKGTISFECHRCLTEVKLNLENCVTRELIETPSESNDDDLFLIEESHINLFPILEEDIILNLPLQLLCSEGCKGICPQCGRDLNEGKCTCNAEKIDPRLEALKNLFT